MLRVLLYNVLLERRDALLCNVQSSIELIKVALIHMFIVGW